MSPAKLRKARRRLGLTQKGLAKALRMGEHGWQSISAWESDNDPRTAPGPVEVALELMLTASAIETRSAIDPKGRGPKGESAVAESQTPEHGPTYWLDGR